MPSYVKPIVARVELETRKGDWLTKLAAVRLEVILGGRTSDSLSPAVYA